MSNTPKILANEEKPPSEVFLLLSSCSTLSACHVVFVLFCGAGIPLSITRIDLVGYMYARRVCLLAAGIPLNTTLIVTVGVYLFLGWQAFR